MIFPHPPPPRKKQQQLKWIVEKQKSLLTLSLVIVQKALKFVMENTGMLLNKDMFAGVHQLLLRARVEIFVYALHLHTERRRRVRQEEDIKKQQN